jgi:hypothetical protein
MNTVSCLGVRTPRGGLPRALRFLVPLLVVALVPAVKVSTVRGAPRGQNRLSVGSTTGASGATVSVPLELGNEDAVSGIQVDIVFDPAVASFLGGTIAARATGMVFSPSVPSAGRLRLVMYYLGGGAIPAGDGAVANLDFQLVGASGTATDLTAEAAELSDPNAQALPVTVAAGYLTVTGGTEPTGACCAPDGNCSLAMQAACTAGIWQGANTVCSPNPCTVPQVADTLSIGTGSGASGSEVTVPLGLHNTQAVGGLQLDVLFDPAVVSFASAAITSRATGMSIPSSNPSAGRLRLLMYSVSADSIAAGEGAVANLTFRVIGPNEAGTDLTPDSVTVSDPHAQALPVTTTSGHITVTGGGTPTGACCAPAGACTLMTELGCTAGTWQGASTTCAPNPCPPPSPPDTLSVGSGTGPSGGQVTISISLANHVAVRGIQADIQIDPTALRFDSGAAVPRVGSMVFEASTPASGVVRILMYYGDTNILAPGRGPVANLVFGITGPDGSASVLTAADVVVADAHNQAIPSVGGAGQVAVVGGGSRPELHLAVLKNPGRTRTLQIFVSSDVGLDAPPTAQLAGGPAVPLTQLSGANVYEGTVSVEDGVASATVQATGLHGGSLGTAQTTVTF